jgi:LmbE family N-acetylglucosaminyl deacetylase
MNASNTVIVSPHLDDAILSVGGLIARSSDSVTVVTVFAGDAPQGIKLSSWDALCGFISPATAVSVRRREDQAACDVLGVRSVHLPYPDGPYRLAECDLGELGMLLRDLPKDTRILIPAGIGSNPDHIEVREKSLRFLAHHDRTVMLYSDLPYSGGIWMWADRQDPGFPDQLSLSAIGSLLATSGNQLSPPIIIQLTPREWEVKQRAVLKYSSQLAPVASYMPRFTSFPGPLQLELLWEIKI